MNVMPRARLGQRAGARPVGTGGSGSGLPPGMPPDPPPRMRPLRTGPFGVLDVGSSKICCLIGRTDADGSVRVDGFGMFASRGVRNGGITDLDEAKYAILMAVADAEQMAHHHLRSVVVNLSCGQPVSRPMNLQWPIGGRPVTEQDLKRVLQEARGRTLQDGRETMHVLPLGFEVDETPGVADPRGLHCENLTAHLHIIDSGATAYRNLLTTISRAELDVSEMVSAPIAAGLATLVEDERQLGATVIDMGGGTTDMAVFSDGHVVHTAQIPLGGGHVTNDIARMLSTPVAHAERLKTLYGNAEGSPDDEREMLPVPLVGEEEHQIHKVPRSQVVSIIRPRLEETFEMVRDKLESAGLQRESGNRVVLTGGASQLVGAREMAARILDRQVRLGRPTNIRGLPELHDGPAFATAAGLLAWASGIGRSLPDIDTGEEPGGGMVRRIIEFLRDRI
ncbi:MAG: cell division protein FtsA [Janthinobacterium lividum]